jgi:hypothetical protein
MQPWDGVSGKHLDIPMSMEVLAAAKRADEDQHQQPQFDL